MNKYSTESKVVEEWDWTLTPRSLTIVRTLPSGKAWAVSTTNTSQVMKFAVQVGSNADTPDLVIERWFKTLSKTHKVRTWEK